MKIIYIYKKIQNKSMHNLDEIISKVLNESLNNIGTLYHFTGINGFINICNENRLVAYEGNKSSQPMKRGEFRGEIKKNDFGLCFTRLKSSQFGYPFTSYKKKSFIVRFSFDGSRLNKIRGARITDVNYWQQYGRGNMSPKMKKTIPYIETYGEDQDESEERLNIECLPNVSNYIIRTDICISKEEEKYIGRLKSIVNTEIGSNTFVYFNRKDFDFGNRKCMTLQEYLDFYDANNNKQLVMQVPHQTDNVNINRLNRINNDRRLSMVSEEC